MGTSKQPFALNTKHRLANVLFGQTLSVRNKILVGFGGVLLLMTVSLGVNFALVASVEDTALKVVEKHQPVMFSFLELNEKINLATANLNAYLLTGYQENKQNYHTLKNELQTELDRLRGGIEKKEIQIDLIKMQKIAEKFSLYHQHGEKLLEVNANNIKNYPGLAEADKLLNPINLAYMGLINEIIQFEEKQRATPEQIKAISLLHQQRNSWVQMINSIRIFFTTRSRRDLENVDLYWRLNGEKWNELKAMNIEIGSEVAFDALNELAALHAQYKKDMPAVTKIFLDEAWRADAYLLRTEVGPIVNELRVLLKQAAQLEVDKSIKSGAEVTESLTKLRDYTLVLLVLGLCIGTVLAGIIASAIVPPIRDLMNAAKRVAAGDLDVTVNITNQDEIGSLAVTFNAMVQGLNSLQKEKNRYMEELRALNLDLENRVATRTHDLAVSEARVRAILETVGEAIVTTNAMGDIETLNPMANIVFQANLDQLIGVNITTLAVNLSETVSTLHEQGNIKIEELYAHLGHRQIECIGVRLSDEQFPMEIGVTKMKVRDEVKYVCVMRDISLRKDAELRLNEAQRQLVDAAHKSGMAEIATGVLHNIGNILNSANLSLEEIVRMTKTSKVDGLLKAAELLKVNYENLEEFICRDEKGKRLVEYYIKIADVLVKESAQASSEITSLSEKISMMRDVIRTQQSYAKSSFIYESLDISRIIDDAIKVQEIALYKNGVILTKDIQGNLFVLGQNSRLLQTLTNIIKNAIEAVNDNDAFGRHKTVHVEAAKYDTELIYVKIKDNGCGIDQKNINKIFNHGYTTKEDGHGFGLHSCANALTEMNGKILVSSDGPGLGAEFILLIPIAKKSSVDEKIAVNTRGPH